MRRSRYRLMLRFFVPIAILGSVTTLVACSGSDPVADNAVDEATAPAEVDVLPPDESVATPATDLETGDDVNVSHADGGGRAIPAAFHGRWGLTPGDCVPNRSDNKGLLIVSADGMSFYEAQAKPAGELRFRPKSVSGAFAFTGEGENWRKHEVLELRDNKLVRTKSDPMASYTYARCTG